MITVLPHPRLHMSLFLSPLCSTAPCCLHRKWTELFSPTFQQHGIYCVNSGEWRFLFLELPLEEIKSFFPREALISPEGGGPKLCYRCGYKFVRGIFRCQTSSEYLIRQQWRVLFEGVFTCFLFFLPLNSAGHFLNGKDLRNYSY